ncbi:MAG: hypothetical protein ACRDUY_08605 [Nitriliruptorales bacterium]
MIWRACTAVSALTDTDVMPKPASVTKAAARLMIGTQSGAVISATRMSPSSKRSSSSGDPHSPGGVSLGGREPLDEDVDVRERLVLGPGVGRLGPSEGRDRPALDEEDLPVLRKGSPIGVRPVGHPRPTRQLGRRAAR